MTTLYTVILTGWSENRFSQQRRDQRLFSIGQTLNAYTFPITGQVIGLNKNGEPIVVPDRPAWPMVLSYFKFQKV